MVLPQMTFDLMQAYETLGPLALIIGGITVYGVFVFNFYRFLARKDIVTLNLQKHNQARRRALRKTISVVFYIFKFLVLYPVFVFFWFSIMAGLLYLMSRNQTTETVMLIAMGVVGAIRVCSYYKEALATDIAKILPFALLGITLIDSSIVRLVQPTEGVIEAALQWESVVYYLTAVVSLEFLLRIVSGIFGFFRDRRKSRRQSREQQPKPEVKQTGPHFGAAGAGTLYEPRPVGLGSASSSSPGRQPVMNSRPSFLNGHPDEGLSPSSEPVSSSGSDSMSGESGRRRSRPAYPTSFATELPNKDYRPNGGHRLS